MFYVLQIERKELIMKTLIHITKFLSIILMSSVITFGLFANNKYSGYLENVSKLSMKKTSLKAVKTKKVNLAEFDNRFIKDKHKNLENWMFHLSCKTEINKDTKTLEPWMFESDKWQIQKMEWDIEPIEKPTEIELWMFVIHIESCNKTKYLSANHQLEIL